MNNLVSVNIVTWNSMKYIPDCLAALHNQTHRNFEVIVVDNASTDGTVEFIRSSYPSVRLVQNSGNAGFCRGHNQAIRLSDSAFVLPLNPDVTMTPTYIEELVKALMEEPQGGIAVAKLYLPGGNLLDGAGLSISRARRQYLRGHGEADDGTFQAREYVFGADGAAPLYRRAMLEDIRLGDDYLDEDFFSHKEDLDLSWRSQLYGWRCIYVPAAVASHDRNFKPSARQRMSGEVKRHAVKNRYLTMVKNELPLLFLRDLPFIIWYDLKILGYLLLFERSSLPALADFVRLLPQAIRKRRVIMGNRKVSATYMGQFFR